MSSETVTSMLRLRPRLAPRAPSPAPRHKAAPAASGGRGAAVAPARARETKAGREPTFRSFGGPAASPGLGKGEGPQLGEEQCGRRPRPSVARVPGEPPRGDRTGAGARARLLAEKGGAAARTCARGGRAGASARRSQQPARGVRAVRAHAERSLECSGPQHVARPYARAPAPRPKHRCGPSARTLPHPGLCCAPRPGAPYPRGITPAAARWGHGGHRPETAGPGQVQP